MGLASSGENRVFGRIFVMQDENDDDQRKLLHYNKIWTSVVEVKFNLPQSLKHQRNKVEVERVFRGDSMGVMLGELIMSSLQVIGTQWG